MNARTIPFAAALALLAGCAPGPAEDFASVLPDDRILINMPIDLAGARSEVGDTSAYYALTAQITTDVNGLIGLVLDTVDHITDFDPTWSDEEDDTAVWGPWQDGANDIVMAVHRDRASDTYTWSISARASGTGDEDWVAVFAGEVEATGDTTTGRFAIDFDALSTFDPEEATAGVFYVAYELSADQVDATAGFEGFSVDMGEETTATYHYAQSDGRGGLMDLAFLADVTGSGVQETQIVRSRWQATGEGRADAYLTGGDFGELVYTATECWDDGFGVRYYENSAELVSNGDESSCVFAEPEWNESDDANAR